MCDSTRCVELDAEIQKLKARIVELEAGEDPKTEHDWIIWYEDTSFQPDRLRCSLKVAMLHFAEAQRLTCCGCHLYKREVSST